MQTPRFFMKPGACTGAGRGMVALLATLAWLGMAMPARGQDGGIPLPPVALPTESSPVGPDEIEPAAESMSAADAAAPELPDPAAAADAEARAAELITPQRLADLDSDQWVLRENATRALLQENRITAEMITPFYLKSPSAEQRWRLLHVAQHHLLRRFAERLVQSSQRAEMRASGSLGVQLGWLTPEEALAAGRPAIRVENTLAGFPAYALLQMGDLIYAIDGQAVPVIRDGDSQVNALREMIQKHTAGQTVQVGILREGKEMTVAMQLSSMDVLRIMYEADGISLQPMAQGEWRQFEKRLQRMQRAQEVLKEKP